jgi:hypothetical protein
MGHAQSKTSVKYAWGLSWQRRLAAEARIESGETPLLQKT